MSDGPAGAIGHPLAFLSRSDQGERVDGVQINVVDGHAYIGHMFTGGISVLDVRDHRNPAYVTFVPAPPNSWSIRLQAQDDLLLVMNGVDIYKAELGIKKGVYPCGASRPLASGRGMRGACLAHLEQRCDSICVRLGDAPRCGGRTWPHVAARGRTARAPAHALAWVPRDAGGALGTAPAGTPGPLRVQAPGSWGRGHAGVAQDTGQVARCASWLHSEQPLAFATGSVTI